MLVYRVLGMLRVVCDCWMRLILLSSLLRRGVLDDTDASDAVRKSDTPSLFDVVMLIDG
jgi:hypothetical protein